MLVIILPEETCEALYQDAASKQELEVDLKEQVIRRPNGETVAFNVDPFRRSCLLDGLDDIGSFLSISLCLKKKKTTTRN